MPKYILHEMPDMNHTGKRKVFPKLKTITRIDEEKLVERIGLRGGAFSKGTIKGVLTALSQSVADMLSYGYTVDVPGLGVFSLALDFDDEKPDARRTKRILVLSISFVFMILSSVTKDTSFANLRFSV